MSRIVGTDFFDRPALVVARDLIGKFLVRRTEGETNAYMITETEAYFGFQDQGSHARRGKTRRNTPMFGKAGTIYVYFTYGMHWMLNLVCGKEGFPAAVLIRGVMDDPPAGGGHHDGPGKLTRALRIDSRLNALPLGKKSGLWVEDRGLKVQAKDIKRTPRIGLGDRGIWTQKLWRFVLKTSHAIGVPSGSPAKK